jgi:hypothetical protein
MYIHKTYCPREYVYGINQSYVQLIVFNISLKRNWKNIKI